MGKKLLKIVLASALGAAGILNINGIEVNAGTQRFGQEDSTAYSLTQKLSNGQDRLTHSGKRPAWGMVAAHLDYDVFFPLVQRLKFYPIQ